MHMYVIMHMQQSIHCIISPTPAIDDVMSLSGPTTHAMFH